MSEKLPPVPDVAAMRRQYNLGALREEAMLADPVEQFTAWFRDAVSAQCVEPNAMSLATAGADGRPLVRTVLLKNYDARGFVFYTNLESRKARQLKENPHAALLLPWLLLERQVVVTGPVERLSVADTVKYFMTRPRDSQIAAWASQQSSPLSSRQVLETTISQAVEAIISCRPKMARAVKPVSGCESAEEGKTLITPSMSRKRTGRCCFMDMYF